MNLRLQAYTSMIDYEEKVFNLFGQFLSLLLEIPSLHWFFTISSGCLLHGF